jgi:hypothetical protein
MVRGRGRASGGRRPGRTDRGDIEQHADRSDRICAGCGRAFAWRPSLAAVWHEVRWCSDDCRRRGVRPVDRALEVAIDELLDARARDATICPSEAARRVDPDGWRELMEPARRAARRMVAAGTLEIVQGGRVVDPSRARGPIRLRRARSVG